MTSEVIGGKKTKILHVLHLRVALVIILSRHVGNPVSSMD